MLRIRFTRVGKKNQPAYKIVVIERSGPPRGGRFVEVVGSYNPLTKNRSLRKDRIQYWLSKGAKPSETLYNLLISEKILAGKKIPVHNKSLKSEERTENESSTSSSSVEKKDHLPDKETPNTENK